MPSDKDPNSTVAPGVGRLLPGEIPASTLGIPLGGSADLASHVADPVDAHMAGAIGIPQLYIPSNEQLKDPPGLIGGESALDFIARAKDLYPVPPNRLGFNDTRVVNSGQPDWDVLKYATQALGSGSVVGGWTDAGGNVVPSKCLVPVGTVEVVPSAFLYPADRGLLALYHSDSGVFGDGTAVLVAALWLGATGGRPSGLSTIDSADFSPYSLTTGQYNYTGNGSGLNKFKLTYRVPRLRDYTDTVADGRYTGFSSSFYGHQIAKVSVIAGAMILSSVGPSYGGSFLLVHYRETYPTELTDFDGASLAGSALSSGHLYSAPVTEGDFDLAEMGTLNRRYIFTDTKSALVPSISSPSANTGVVATTHLSGVLTHSGALTFAGSVGVLINDFFGDVLAAKSYLTGRNVSADVPAGYTSLVSPLVVSFSEFGGRATQVPYNAMQRLSDSTYFSLTNAPQPTDVALYTVATSIPGPVVAYTTPFTSISQVEFTVNSPFVGPVTATSTRRFIFNSHARTGVSTASTATYEPFVDERYRYKSLSDFGPPVTVEPAGGDLYDSSAVLVADVVSRVIGATEVQRALQVVGDQLVYPHVNFGSGITSPASQPDYSAVFSGDALHTNTRQRDYVRVFDTGSASYGGRFRIAGASLLNFGSNDTGDGANPNILHPGRMIIEIRVPNDSTGWLDLGLSPGGVATLTPGCLLSVEHQYASAGRGVINTGTLQELGKTVAELGVAAGDTVFIPVGDARGLYTVDYLGGTSAEPILNLTSLVGTLVDGNVAYEIYKGSDVKGSIYTYTTNHTSNGPTADNGSGEFPIALRVTMMQFTGDTSTPDLGLTEIEWLPL